MQLTEKHIREFFPKDKRFLHYVAKRYGYTFQNEDNVDAAHHNAAVAITKMYNDGREFDSNEELYGIVMMAFKFAIMSSYAKGKRQQFNDDLIAERQLLPAYEDSDYSNILSRIAVAHPEEYDNTEDFMLLTLKNELEYYQFAMLQMRMDGMTYSDMSKKFGLTTAVIKTELKKVKNKYNEITERIEEQERKHENERLQAHIRETARRVQRQTQYRRKIEKEKERNRGSEAMSWLDSDYEVPVNA